MRLSARVDYALRAMSELAAADAPRTVEQLSEAQRIPTNTWKASSVSCGVPDCCEASAGRRAGIGWQGRPTRSASPT